MAYFHEEYFDGDQAAENADYELNAQYDSVREAYASSELDPYQEGHCNHCFEAMDAGEEPLSFEEWKKSLTERTAWEPADDEDLPF